MCAGLDLTMELRGCKAIYTLSRCTNLVKDKYMDLNAPGGMRPERAFLVRKVSDRCAEKALYRCMPQRRMVNFSAVWNTMFSIRRPMMITIAKPANTLSV